MRFRRVSYAIGLTAASASIAGVLPDLERCVSTPRGSERTKCLVGVSSRRALGDPDIEALERLMAGDAAAVERAVEAAVARPTAAVSDPPSSREAAYRARLLDLHGQALEMLELHPQATESFLASLALDDGTSRVAWLTPDGRAKWRASLDPGCGRVERTARSLLEQGRKDEARALFGRALALGAQERARQGWRLAGGDRVPGLDAVPSELAAPVWLQRLPEIDVALLDGSSLALGSARDKILLLDFWASWCGPCVQELPHLQALYRAEKDRGLEAIAINADEPIGLARDAARTFGLTMPIGTYSPALDLAFKVRTLPTLILADKQGRIRARWDGYTAGLEKVIAEQSRLLLSDDSLGASRKIADVVLGGGLLWASWERDLGAPIRGLAIARDPDSTPTVLASAGKQVAVLDGSGGIVRRIDVATPAGRLLESDLDGDGRSEVVSIRPGSDEVCLFNLIEGAHHTWRAPAVLLDAAFLPALPGSSPRTRIALAAVDGVYLADPETGEAKRVEHLGETSSVAVATSPPSPLLVALTSRGEIQWLDSFGRPSKSVPAPAESWKLVMPRVREEGFGTIPVTVVASATGRLLPDTGVQLALATQGGDLIVLDLADGRERFRAQWTGIADLAMGDLDGDGMDELIVAADRHVFLLHATRGASLPHPRSPSPSGS